MISTEGWKDHLCIIREDVHEVSREGVCGRNILNLKKLLKVSLHRRMKALSSTGAWRRWTANGTPSQHRMALHFTLLGRSRQDLTYVICLTVLRSISWSARSYGHYSQDCARLDCTKIAYLLPQSYKKYEFVTLCFLSKNITSSLRGTYIFIS
jgi:hypothetical protein